MKRVLSVDYGDARTGIALTDTLGMMAHGFKTLKIGSVRKLVEAISDIVEENVVTTVVIGNPVNMNGTIGERSDKSAVLAEKLRKRLGSEVEIVLFDERYTTMAAHRILNETDTKGKKRKEVVDTLSAEIILQNYCDKMKNIKS